MILARTALSARGHCFAVGPYGDDPRGPVCETAEDAFLAFIKGPTQSRVCRCGATIVYLRRWQFGRRPTTLDGDWGRYEIDPGDRQWLIPRDREEHACG